MSINYFRVRFRQWFCNHRIKFVEIQHWPDGTLAAQCYKCSKYLIWSVHEEIPVHVDLPIEDLLYSNRRKHYDEASRLK